MSVLKRKEKMAERCNTALFMNPFMRFPVYVKEIASILHTGGESHVHQS